MNLVEPDRKKAPAKTPRLLIVSILLSLALHILIIILLPYIQQKVAKPQQKPTIVQLVERPQKAKKQKQQQKPAKFELDQTPTQPPPKIPVESQRKADQDQRVEREQAPKGDDVRDQKAQATPPVPQKRQPVPPKNLKKR